MSINEINAEIEIKEKDINKNKRIINTFESFIREYKLRYNKHKYKNQKVIEEKYKIIINNEMISFSIFKNLKNENIILNIHLLIT